MSARGVWSLITRGRAAQTAGMPYADLDEIQLYYETAGSGRPVILINSWGTTLRIWDQVVRDLAADHEVITYDWRGCGRSERTFAGNTIDQNGTDLRSLISCLRLDRPVLVGSSVGSLFALETARSGTGAGGVVVLDGPGYWGTVMADTLHQYVDALAADRATAVTASAKNMYASPSEALCAWTTRQILDASPHIDALFLEQTGYDPRAWLAELPLPVLYVHGELDKAVPVHVPEELAALTPGGRAVVIQGAGHLSQQDKPADVATAVRDFTDTVSGLVS